MRAHIFGQIKSLGSVAKQPKMKCLCGKVVPIMFAYRCYQCGAFFCPKCAGKHFGGFELNSKFQRVKKGET